MSLLDEVATDPQALLLSPGGPSADGKQGTGMQISLMVESRLHHETANQVLPVRLSLSSHAGTHPEAESLAVAREGRRTGRRGPEARGDRRSSLRQATGRP